VGGRQAWDNKEGGVGRGWEIIYLGLMKGGRCRPNGPTRPNWVCREFKLARVDG
jgi:hypothetical protein